MQGFSGVEMLTIMMEEMSCFWAKTVGSLFSWWSRTFGTKDKSPGDNFLQWGQQSGLHLIGHADVTLIPGALSHIRHMTRDGASKATIL